MDDGQTYVKYTVWQAYPKKFSGMAARFASGMFEEVGIDLVGDAAVRRCSFFPPVPVGKPPRTPLQKGTTMPLTINVGLSRKASKDYQSAGTSINITAELDQALLARPDDLQRQIGDLYQQAEHAMTRQASQPASAPASSQGQGSAPSGGNGNGSNGGNGHGGNGRVAPMTQSQLRAIHAIAKRLGIDPTDECRRQFGWDLNRLSIRDASTIIDHLKSLQPAGGR
jgi:hypothetical protein